jgi:multiple sugar transport system ATP-binding protein
MRRNRRRLVVVSGIAFEHVSKVFADGTAAVVDLVLGIEDGEFCVLVGPSGCGKSTVLRLIAGLEQVTRGVIRLGDEVVNDVPPQERDLAMVFAGSALYPHLDVAANLGFSLKMQGAPPAERADRVKGAAARLGLGGLLGRRPRQLAEGERQRAALGRALVRRPRAFLMDEPLSGLDASFRVQMRAALARLHRDRGTTILYVTHDHTEAMALGDRVAVMRQGQLEQVDEPRRLYERPSTVFVASFLGSPPMNLWHARLAEHDGRVVVEAGRQRLVVPAEVLFDRDGVEERVGEHLILGLRPEAFALAGPRDAGPIVELPVTGVEDLGSHQLVHLEAEGAGMQLANASDAIRAGVRVDLEDDATAVFTRPTATLVARLPSHARVRPGERLRLSVDFDRVHFFDPDTQRALR